MGNQKQTIQINWQHWVYKMQDEDKQKIKQNKTKQTNKIKQKHTQTAQKTKKD